MSETISPLAPAHIPELPEISGVICRIARARYKEWDRCDLTYIELAQGTTVAGVLTKSKCPSPEVEWCQQALSTGLARGLVVNAGNANAFTGGRGKEAVQLILSMVSNHLACAEEEIFVSSTGVIGVPLPKDKVETGLNSVFIAEPCSWSEAAATIMTTDTFPKMATTSALIDGKTVYLNGIVKGSGMIAPDMATMLGYIFTDACVNAEFLQEMLSAATSKSFNCITVDSDTSTSDTVLAFATGQNDTPALNSFKDPGADAFQAALSDLCMQMAHLVIRDGEGASKFIEIAVTAAESDKSAKRIALSIANSPLVKTAIAGEDANWGRIVMAVGKAGEPADRDKLSIGFGGVTVARDGLVVPDYDETPVTTHLKGDEIDISVDMGLGHGKATVWTCDLTHGYIEINADYRS
ncbi:MAG: bifunctional glutamate N-acetyltransferase/amino-acid acetyltransferase ArgJ [Parasphingorhabdus sp.]|uniref:bifunctional glutamate N-acetyltransferase/amino-acid acetyltransferase ArgJ n=1 Tax=Parasphingorhabdus sp. TaxID=2709688 RepID=UPI003001DC75